MSLKRKVKKNEERDAHIASGGRRNPVKEVMKRRKRLEQMSWKAQIIVPVLMRACGHFVRQQKSLDQYHESIYVRGTTITKTGTMPRDWQAFSEGMRVWLKENVPKRGE